MDMLQTLTSILKNGGDLCAYKRVTALGADLTTPDTWHDGTFRIDSDLGFDQPMEPIYLESGALGNVGHGNYQFQIVVTSAQLDASLINFINKKATLTDYYAMFFDAGLGADAKKLELFVVVGKFQRSLKWQGKTRQPVWTYTALTNMAAVTPATVPSWAIGAANAFAVPVRDHFKAVETAAA